MASAVRWWVAVATGAVSLAGLAVQAQGPDPGRRGGPSFQGGPGRRGPSEEDKERARTRIGMTKEQQAQIEAAYEDHGKRSRELYKQIGEAQRQLFELYASYEVDRKQQRILTRQILGLRHKLMQVHSDTEDQLRKVLSKEQFEKFRALMKEEADRMRKEWERRRGGPPPIGGRDR